MSKSQVVRSFWILFSSSSGTGWWQTAQGRCIMCHVWRLQRTSCDASFECLFTRAASTTYPVKINSWELRDQKTQSRVGLLHMRRDCNLQMKWTVGMTPNVAASFQDFFCSSCFEWRKGQVSGAVEQSYRKYIVMDLINVMTAGKRLACWQWYCLLSSENVENL